jgi:hypothetical protein
MAPIYRPEDDLDGPSEAAPPSFTGKRERYAACLVCEGVFRPENRESVDAHRMALGHRPREAQPPAPAPAEDEEAERD